MSFHNKKFHYWRVCKKLPLSKNCDISLHIDVTKFKFKFAIVQHFGYSIEKVKIYNFDRNIFFAVLNTRKNKDDVGGATF